MREICNYFTLLNCFHTNAFNANYVILEACLSTRNHTFPGCHVLEAMIAAVGCVIQHNVKYPGFRGCAGPHQTILNSNFAFFGAYCHVCEFVMSPCATKTATSGADPWRGFEDVPTGIQAAITPPGAGTVGWCQ